MARVRTGKASKSKVDSVKPASGSQVPSLRERSKTRKDKAKAKEDAEAELVTGHQSEDVRFSVPCYATLFLIIHDFTPLAYSCQRCIDFPLGAQFIQQLDGRHTAGCKESEEQGEEGQTGRAERV